MRRVAIVAICALLLGLGTWLLLKRHRVVLPDPPPLPDARLVDPELALMVNGAIGDIRAAPRDSRARAKLAMIYHANNLTELARIAYEHALLADRHNSRLHFLQARLQAQQGEISKAIATMERAVRYDDRYAPAHWRMGFWLLDQGELEAAARAFQIALSIDANDVAARAGLARVAMQRGDYARAARLLREAIMGREESPVAPYLQQLLGNALLRQGRDHAEEGRTLLAGLSGLEDAEPPWPDPWTQDLLRYRAGYSVSVTQIQQLLDAGQTQPAITQLNKLLKSRPDDLTALNYLGLAYVQSNQFDRAVQTFQRALTHNPKHYPTYINMAHAFEKKQDISTSARYARLAVEVDPNLPMAHVQLGRLSVMENKLDDAATELATALRCGEQDESIRELYGQVLLRLSRWREAEKIFSQLIESAPQRAAAHGGLAYARAELGDVARAKASLEHARRLDAKEPLVAAATARLQELTGGSPRTRQR